MSPFLLKYSLKYLLIKNYKLSTKPLMIYKVKGLLWFRIFGKGLLLVNRSIHSPPFSVRSGSVKEYGFKNGVYRMQFLK